MYSSSCVKDLVTSFERRVAVITDVEDIDRAFPGSRSHVHNYDEYGNHKEKFISCMTNSTSVNVLLLGAASDRSALVAVGSQIAIPLRILRRTMLRLLEVVKMARLLCMASTVRQAIAVLAAVLEDDSLLTSLL